MLTTKMQEEYLKHDQILKKKMKIRYGVMHCCHDVIFCCNDISHRFLRHENISVSPCYKLHINNYHLGFCSYCEFSSKINSINTQELSWKSSYFQNASHKTHTIEAFSYCYRLAIQQIFKIDTLRYLKKFGKLFLSDWLSKPKFVAWFHGLLW